VDVVKEPVKHPRLLDVVTHKLAVERAPRRRLDQAEVGADDAGARVLLGET
jgi:hypothetical protein